jgi:hypothetical protein
MPTAPSGPPIYPFPRPPDPVPAIQRDPSGRYVFTSPGDASNFYAIADAQKDFVIVGIHTDTPHAAEIAWLAWQTLLSEVGS